MGGRHTLPTKVKTPCHPVVNYKDKSDPVISVNGNGPGFNYPWGVAIDSFSGNIYVGEQNSDRVQVFDSQGVFLYMFGKRDMKSPLGIAIHQDRIFITQYENNFLLVYDINGEFISNFHMCQDQSKSTFKVRGLAINESNEDVYVCDVTNNKILVISDSTSTRQFGSDIIVKTPIDIQVTQLHIVVLSNYDPYLYTFDFDFNPTQNIFSDSFYSELVSPNGFFIDQTGNFIISNFRNNEVIIVDSQTLSVHKLDKDIKSPIGVAVDSKGRIVVVGHNQKLLIF